MPFSKFISIVLETLGSYYFIMILFDVLKSNNEVGQRINHRVHFDLAEIPVIVSDEPEENFQAINSEASKNLEKYVPVEDSFKAVEIKENSPIIDLGLETISGDAYTVNAENLSKFMIA
jgi:hypothetical protein